MFVINKNICVQKYHFNHVAKTICIHYIEYIKVIMFLHTPYDIVNRQPMCSVVHVNGNHLSISKDTVIPKNDVLQWMEYKICNKLFKILLNILGLGWQVGKNVTSWVKCKHAQKDQKILKDN